MYRWVRPLLFLLPAELAHRVTFAGLRLVVRIPGIRRLLGVLFPTPEGLEVDALGLRFPNPLGLAAGFDKDAKGFEALAQLGFGHVEVGTLTARSQPGNERPRLFRLPADRALINRFGFNNRGAASAVARLAKSRTGVVGVNIGKSKVIAEEHAADDYGESARLLAPHADYMVVNVSSPNTPRLRDLQSVEKLRPILLAVRRAIDEVCRSGKPAVLIKIAPDLSNEDIDAVVDLALELGLAGIIATNTTISREGLNTSPQRLQDIGAGGLSGAPLRARALEVLERVHARCGDRLVLIAVGGIETAEDAWARILAGAHLVQVYTGFVYGGPTMPGELLRGLAARLREHGFATLAQARGRGNKHPALVRSSPSV